MATFTKHIVDSNDDGSRFGNGGSWSTTNFQVGRTILNQSASGALRFQNVTIPQGSTINSAKITFTPSGSYSSDEIILKISGIAEDNTASMSSDPLSRSKTSANVSFHPNPSTHQTPKDITGLASIVQEIVNRGGWSSGNAMGFIIEDNGGTTDRTMNWFDFSSGGGWEAILEIDYTSSVTTTSTSTTTTSTSTTSTSTTTTTLPEEPVMYGIKIFKKDAPDTLSPQNFFLNSRKILPMIHEQKSFKATYIRFSGLHITIPIVGLNYRPRVWVYMQRMNHDGNLDTDYHLLEWSYWGATKIGYQRAKVYIDRIEVDYQDDLVDDLSINFSVLGYYYIFKKEVKE